MKQATNTIDEGGAAVAVSRGSNQSGMRVYNERLVLSLVRQAGALAKSEIARMTGLSAQTVSVIMRSLEADGLLKKGKPIRGKVGQPSVPMGLARDGAFFFGLNVGRRRLDLILTDFLGHVKLRVGVNHRYPTPDGVVEFANDAIGEILDQLSPEHQSRVAGLGIALPFRLWDWAKPLGVALSEMENWRDRDIVAEIAGRWDFPVLVCNDASAACGAELVFSDQSKPRDFLYFFVGFFVGGGLVLDGSLFTGRSGNAAALGSMPVTISNDEPSQLVEVASLAALEAALVAKGCKCGMISEVPDSWILPDEILDKWLDKAAFGLAQAIMSSVCVIDVDRVLIDGWLPSGVRADLVWRIGQHLGEFSLAGVDAPEVCEGSIGCDARSLGAASLPLSERFLVDRNAFLKGPAS